MGSQVLELCGVGKGACSFSSEMKERTTSASNDWDEHHFNAIASSLSYASSLEEEEPAPSAPCKRAR